jgi:uncharacterized protein (DUF433 family)
MPALRPIARPLRPTSTGCYDAGRAAALAGVPASLLTGPARRRVVVPSVSRERERLWSWTDLVALRLAWVRIALGTDPGDPAAEVAGAVGEIDLEAAAGEGKARGGLIPIRRLATDESGVLLASKDEDGEPGHVDLFGVFQAADEDETTVRGPDLLRPRPHLRIVPGKLGGEPHVAGSRLPTRSIAALAGRGLGPAEISTLFLDQTRAAIAEAIDLERQLAGGAGQ